jgi:hypothetical protein
MMVSLKLPQLYVSIEQSYYSNLKGDIMKYPVIFSWGIFYLYLSLLSNSLKNLAVLYFCLLTKKFLIFIINLTNIVTNLLKNIKFVNSIDKKI